MSVNSNAPPSFQKAPTITQVDSGLGVLIDCVVKANPAPTCKWSLNNEPLTNTERIVENIENVARSNDQFKCSLLIKNVQLTDGGSYRLIIENSLGELKATVNLKLQADDDNDDDNNKSSGSGKGPKFTQKPEIRQEDEGVVFECRLTADPPPTCDWYKGNEILKHGGRYVIKTQSLPDESYVVSCMVKDIQEGDGGAYRVVAKNSKGEATATLNLNIADNKGRPKILDNIEIRPFLEKVDDIIMIKCICEADPAPQFLWYFKGKPLTQSKKHTSSVSQDNSNYVAILTISNVVKSDFGDYRLVAKNSKGEHAADIALQGTSSSISLPANGFAPKQIGSTKFLREENNVILSIDFTASPDAVINWTKNDVDSLDDSRFVIETNKIGNAKFQSKLNIKNASAKDAANYVCNALNEFGTAKVCNRVAFKNGAPSLSSEDEIAPVFVTEPKITFDSEHKILRIECSIKSRPMPSVQWFKQKLPISDGSKTKIKLVPTDNVNEYTAILIINNFKSADNGFYKVEASNSAGMANLNISVHSDHAELRNLQPEVRFGEPRLKYDRKAKKVNISLECSTSNTVSKPNIVWRKDNKILTNASKRVKISTMDDHHSSGLLLQIDVSDVSKNDFGKYMVTAELDDDVVERKMINFEDELEENDEKIDSGTDEIESTDSKQQPKDEEKMDKAEDKQDTAGPDSSKIVDDDKKTKNLSKAGEQLSGGVKGAKEAGDSSSQKSSDKPSDEKKVDIIKKGSGMAEEGKTRFTGALRSAVATDGDKAILQCAYESSVPLSEVVWYRENVPLSPSDDNIIVEDDGKNIRLILKDVYVDDTGKYKCIIKSAHGQDDRSSKLTVQPRRGRAARVKPKKVIADKPNVAKQDHQEKRKESSVTGITDATKKPTATNATMLENPKTDISSRKSSITDSENATLHRRFSSGKPTPERGAEKTNEVAEAVEIPIATLTKRDSIESDHQVKRKSTIGKKNSLKPILKPPLIQETPTAIATPFGAGDGAKWPTLRKTTIAKKVPDHWVVHMADKKANEDDGTTTLEATFCRPGGTLRWYKNRVEIFHGQKYKFISEGPVQKLHINKIIPDDSGRYICSVNDIETKGWLEVKSGKPDFEFYLQLPAKNEVFRTKSFLLECHVNHPECPVKWTKDGKPIDENDKKYSVMRDLTRCLLRINKTAREDEGVYMCEIEDGADKKTSCYLYITEPQWRFSKKLPPNTEVNEDMDATFEVEVEDPDAECEWFHKGEQIATDGSDPRFTMKSYGRTRQLIMSGCKPVNDSGIVECKTGVMVTQTNLIVKPNLRITEGLKDVEVFEGSDVNLNVKLNMPRKQLAWLFNNKRILPDANHVILYDGNEYSLQIKNAEIQSTGIYSVSVDGLTSQCNVTVKEAERKPQIDFSALPTKIDVVEGEKLYIRVPFKANPAAEIHWFKNDKPLMQSSSITVTPNEHEAIIEIPATNKSDAGNYTVKLNNRIGEAAANIDVSIIGKPDAPEGPMRISEITKSGCVLGWRAPPSDGGAPLKHYIVERFDSLTDTWEEVAQIPPDSVKHRIGGLTEGKKYNFRIIAVNKAGKSEPLEASQAIIAKNPYEVASCPGPIEVTDIDSHEVTLQWTPPKSDGGAQIEKYVIEKRSNNQDWTKADTVDGTKCTSVVKNLQDNTAYEFRVVALNKAGMSDPTFCMKPCLTSPKTIKPLIRKGALRDLTVKKGTVIKLTIPFIAKPAPTIVWMRDDKELGSKDDARIKITNTDRDSQFCLRDCLRSDQGVYSVKITNSVGSDISKCHVVVLGPPDKPSGPIKIHECTKTSATITWNPPADDGGRSIRFIYEPNAFLSSPLTRRNYVIEKMDMETGEWTRAGECEGNTFTAPKLKHKHKYRFRVAAESEEGVGDWLETDEPITVKPPFDEPGPPGTPIVSAKDRTHVALKWTAPVNDGGAPVYGYIVERKPKNSDQWVKLHHEDVITTLEFDDKKVKADSFYEYRVTAVNEAGPGLSSSSSNEIQAKPDKEVPKIDKDSLPTVAGRKELRVFVGDPIQLSLPILGTPKPEVKWSKDGVPIASNQRLNIDDTDENLIFTCPCAERGDSGVYEVVVSNELGSDTAQLNLVVIGPPSSPTGPITHENTGKSDVLLKWEAPNDDGGLPVTGYVIEKCPEGSTVWEPCGESISNRTTIKNLEPMQKYSFRVKAQNQRGDSQPIDTSTSILIKPPYDPPGAPTQPEVTSFDKDFVSIKWTKPSNDGGNPIQGYVLEMKEVQPGAQWIPCTSGIIRDTDFKVTTVKPNRNYEFRVKAVNDAGHGDASKPSKAQKTISPVITPNRPQSLNIDKIDSNEAQLTWKAPDEDGGAKITSYIVEKSTGDAPGEWAVVAEVSGRDRSANIPNMKKGSDVSFRVIAVNEAGPSDPSVATDFANVQDPPESPRFIDLSQLKDITCQTHSSFINNAMFKGFPVPSIELSMLHEPERVLDTSRVKAEIQSDRIVIENKDAERSDTGIYKLTLKNSLGSASTTFQVTVYGVPSNPMGPIEANVIDKEQCAISWKSPKDDGGKPISGYTIEKRKPGTDKWIKCGSSRGDVPNCVVHGLEEGDLYEFRVIAENENGSSEPLQTTEPIKIKLPYTIPEKPENVFCTGHTEDTISIGWNEPVSDGGSPLEYYVVEKLDETNPSGWVRIGRASANNPTMTIPRLEEGHQYHFRVNAVNDAGESDWAQTLNPIEAREPDKAPTLLGNDRGEKKIRLKKGEPLQINIEYESSPIPEISVKLDGVELINPNLTINKTNSTYNVPSVDVADGGKYEFVLSNPLGKCSDRYSVEVIDVPEKPEGPLRATEVSESGCILSWDAPKKNGGTDVQRYVIEKMDVKKGKWVPISQYCRDTSFEIFGLKENNEYLFRVAAVNDAGQSEFLQIDDPITAKASKVKPSRPVDFELTKNTFEEVTLKWKPPKDNGGCKIIGYQIESAGSDAPDEWSVLNTEPIRTEEFSIDSLLSGRSYNFRVRAVNAIGVGEAAELEKPVKTKGCSRPPQPPSVPEPYSIGNDFVELAWEPPSDDGGSSVTHYIVEKRQEGDADWTEESLPSSEPYKTVHGLPPHSKFEFRVKAVNALGTSDASASSGKILVSTIENGVPAKINQGLIDLDILPSSPCQLTVKFEGSPEPDVRWFRNGSEISNGPKYDISNTSCTSTLTLTDVWPGDDQSQISCCVSNPFNSETTECMLTVKQAPVVGRYENNLSTREGLSANLKVPINGDPLKSIKVIKCGEDEPDDRFSVFDDGATLTLSLKNTKKGDSGDYKIVLSNDAGEISVPFTLNVRGAPDSPNGPLSVTNVTKDGCSLQWRPPHGQVGESNDKVSHYVVEKRDLTKSNAPWIEVAGYCKDTSLEVGKLMDGHDYVFRVKSVNEEGESEPLYTKDAVRIELAYTAPRAPDQPNATVTSARTIRLNWSKPSGDQGQNPLQYIVEKREKDSPVWVKVVPAIKQPTTWTSMDIPNLVTDQEYEFRVTAYNDAGQSEPSVPSQPIKVIDPDAVKLPNIVFPIDNVTVNEGQDAKFEAELSDVDARFPLEVTWTKGGHEMHSGANCQLSKNGNIVSMTLRQCQESIDGETIGLKIKNQSGLKKCNAIINVLTKPRIKLPSSLQNDVQVYNKLQPISLRIPYTANPKPSVECYLNGKEIDLNAEKCPFAIEQTTRCLTLKCEKGLSEADVGLMKIVLVNSVGKDEANFRTALIKPPEKPADLIVEDIFEDSVIMSWQPSVSDPYSSITGYKIEIQDQSKPQGWKQCGTSRSAKFIMNNLPPGTYSFRVVADSANGSSEPSEPLKDVKIADPREIKKGPDYGTDSDGKPIRGKNDNIPTDYDRCYEDIWKDTTPKDTDHKHLNRLYEDYDIFEEIGSGPFGTIHRGVNKKTGRNHIIKFMPTVDNKEQQLAGNDANLFGDLKDPNIQHIDEVYEGPDSTVFVQEFLAGDTLLEHLKRKSDRLTEPEAINYMRQLCSIVKKMHENHIAHLDLKPDHFVFDTKSNSKKLKLCDLSLARKMIPDNQIQVSMNSVNFAAPEIINREPVGYYTDMWALGSIAYTIIAGEPPFFNSNDDIAADNITRAKLDFPDSKWNEISEEGKDFISKLLAKDKGTRMNIFEALEHPWLKEGARFNPNQTIKPRYDDILNKTRAKYSSHAEPRLGIGRSAFFSPMQRLHYKPYKLYDTVFDVSEARPRIIISKHNSYAMENETVDMNVRVIAFPAADVYWYRKGEEVQPSLKYTKHRTSGTGYALQVNRCQLDDGGEYEVVASNKYGEKRVSVWLHVQAIPEKRKSSPQQSKRSERRSKLYDLDEIWQEDESGPIFTYLLRTRIIQHSSPVKLFCTVKSNPASKINWFKGRTQIGIGEDSRYLSTFQNGVATLTIGRADVDDAGVYRCHAENKLGSSETSCQLFVQTPYTRTRAKRHTTSTPREQTNSEHYRTNRTTRAQTELYEDDERSNKITADTTEQLDLPEPSSSPRRKRSRQSIAGSPPIILEPLSPCTVYEGSILQLRCSVKGRKQRFIWSKEGTEIMKSERIEQDYSSETGFATLTIKSVKKFDYGEYHLKIENDFGCVESSALVAVKSLDKPIDDQEQAADDNDHHEKSSLTDHDIWFTKHLHSTNLGSGESMHLECTLNKALEDGYSFAWQRNGQTVPDNPDFQISALDNTTFILHVNEVFEEDSGYFGFVITTNDSLIPIAQTVCTIRILEANGKDEDESSNQILVYPQSQNIEADKQTDTVITTVLINLSDVEAHYLKDGVDLDPISNYTIKKEGKTITYDLKLVASSHQMNDGFYHLKLLNSQGDLVLSVAHVVNTIN